MQVCVHTNDKQYYLSGSEHLETWALSHKTKSHPNALGKRIWDGSETIHWKIDGKYQWISDSLMEQMIKFAFLEPSFETPLVIRKVNRQESDAQIVIKWLGKKDDTYFNSSSTLAYAYGPSSGIGGDITMNSDVLWLLRNTPLTALEAKEKGYIENYASPDNIIKFYDPLHTIKHEGGHALGMNHLTDISLKTKSVMYPYYNGLRRFGAEDITYLHDLYGKSTVSHIIKETLLNRITKFY